MKPFNLEKALAGEPVVTRDNQPVNNIYQDEGNICSGTVTGTLISFELIWMTNGAMWDNHISPMDLFMGEE